MKNSTFPLIKLPSEIQVSLYLIKEELKSRRFFNGLHRLGLSDCYFQPHLDDLILKSVGLDDETDETFDIYFDILEKRSRKIEPHSESVMKQAFKAYTELVNEKKKLTLKRK